MSESDQPATPPEAKSGQRWWPAWFVFHLATVYLLAKFCTPWLAGFTYGRLLPSLQIPATSTAYEFMYSHVLAFSVIPAVAAGFVNARFAHRTAILVWVVPAIVLIYKLAIFPSSHSVLYYSSPALHYYFGGGFSIPAFHNWNQFWDAAAYNPDMARGLAQLTYTAPFYTGLAYGLSAWGSMRWALTKKAAKKVEQWEESRFGTREEPQDNGSSPSAPQEEAHGTTGPSET